MEAGDKGRAGRWGINIRPVWADIHGSGTGSQTQTKLKPVPMFRGCMLQAVSAPFCPPLPLDPVFNWIYTDWKKPGFESGRLWL